MKATVTLLENMRLIGKNERGNEVLFDNTPDEDGNGGTAASPMENLLMAAAACSVMDIISILKKKRKTINDLKVEMEGIKADEYPKVFTKVHFKFILDSPDAQMQDLERSIELSQTKYCSVSETVRRAGADITWEAVINN